jgi:hypothetical protein
VLRGVGRVESDAVSRAELFLQVDAFHRGSLNRLVAFGRVRFAY